MGLTMLSSILRTGQKGGGDGGAAVRQWSTEGFAAGAGPAAVLCVVATGVLGVVFWGRCLWLRHFVPGALENGLGALQAMRAARPRTRERREAVFSRPGMGFLPFGQPPCQKKGARLRAVAKCGLPLTRVRTKQANSCSAHTEFPAWIPQWPRISNPLAERRKWSRVQIPPRAVQLAPRVPNSTWGAPPTRGRAATLGVTWRFGRRGQMVPGRRHARSSRRALAAAAPRKGFPRQN